LQNEKGVISPKVVGASRSYNSQPEDLVSRKEFEDFKKASQEFWRYMKGCGKAWKKTCFNLISYPI